MLPVYQCKRCDHKWVPRIENPGSCPACHNKNWNKEPTRKSYGFSSIEVGQEVLIPWYTNKNGTPNEQDNAKMTNALSQYMFLTKRKFSRTGSPRGLLIRRLY